MERRTRGNTEDANQENWKNFPLMGIFFLMRIPVIQDEICQGQEGQLQ